MRERDVVSVMQIQAECYVSFIVESEETIRRRLSDFPDTAWVAENQSGICGYLVTYRSRVGNIAPLGSVFEQIADPDCLYLHDLAISERVKGQGLGGQLASLAFGYAIAKGLRYSALVSVQNSQPFWQRLGYEPWMDLSVEHTQNLKTYERQALYMVKTLA